MRNTLAKEVAREARRAPFSRLDKKNREDRIASLIVGMFSYESEFNDVCGARVTNVRFTDRGASIDLADGGTIAVRITAYAPDKD